MRVDGMDKGGVEAIEAEGDKEPVAVYMRLRARPPAGNVDPLG